MAYAIDTQQALRAQAVIAILQVRQRGVRSLVILKDNSLYRTRTRPAVLVRRFSKFVKRKEWLSGNHGT